MLNEACGLLRTVLGAEDVYVVRAGDPYFVRIDAPADPTAYEIKQKGYFLIWHELAEKRELTGGLFQTVDRRVLNPHPLAAGVAATHLALLLPSDESSSEMLIVRGPWNDGLSADQVRFVTAARPLIASLVGTLLDSQRRQRQRDQFHSLSTVTAALTRGQELAAASPAIMTALAKASGFDWVVLTLVSDDIERVLLRVGNNARHAETETMAISLDGELLRGRALVTARHLAQTRRPVLYATVSDAEHEHPLSAEMQRYMERAHVLSTATFPLFSGERLLGTINFAASAPHGFEPDEVAFLTQLCEQAAMAIECLHLHHELRNANAALERAATHDALTGLPNRSLFIDRLQQAVRCAERDAGAVAVLFLDLDDFKLVNDSFGHDVGDRLLQAVAERLRSHLRPDDLAARLGGDEFTVLLEGGSGETRAAQVADRLQAAVRQPFEIAGRRVQVNVSIGVGCDSTGRLGAEGLLREADLAMYRAKAQSKAQAKRLDQRSIDGSSAPAIDAA